MIGTVLFDPLLPWSVLAILAVVGIGGVILAFMRGLSGWALRGLSALVVLAALTGPAFQQEDRAPLTDIVILAEDQSSSQRLTDRPEQTAAAVAALKADGALVDWLTEDEATDFLWTLLSVRNWEQLRFSQARY